MLLDYEGADQGSLNSSATIEDTKEKLSKVRMFEIAYPWWGGDNFRDETNFPRIVVGCLFGITLPERLPVL